MQDFMFFVEDDTFALELLFIVFPKRNVIIKVAFKEKKTYVKSSNFSSILLTLKAYSVCSYVKGTAEGIG